MKQNEDRIAHWLRLQVWEAPGWKVFLVALALAPLCIVGENLVIWPVELVCSVLGWKDRLPAVQAEQAELASHWFGVVSLLALAPVVENLMCLFWLRKVFHASTSWWRGPAWAALVAAGFHVLTYSEPRYVVVGVPFFGMCCLMGNVRDSRVGYWASVLLHAAGNALTFAMAHLGL